MKPQPDNQYVNLYITRTIRLCLARIAVVLAIAIPALAQDAPPPVPMTLVIYEAGPAWKQGKPPGEKNMGPHLAYVGELFKAGKVIAYGPQTDIVRGFYVLSGSDKAVADGFIKGDPSTKARVFKPVSRLAWGVAVNAFAPSKEGESYFILRYAPGPN